jgi:hypothetical protein
VRSAELLALEEHRQVRTEQQQGRQRAQHGGIRVVVDTDAQASVRDLIVVLEERDEVAPGKSIDDVPRRLSCHTYHWP